MTILEQATELKNSAYLFIAKKQTKAGGFISQTQTESGLEFHHTVFYPALISTILDEIPQPDRDPLHQNINNRLKNFWLLQPRLTGSSWQTYWAIQDHNYHTLKYPPDLDDSSLVLLAKHNLYPEADFSEINTDYVITLTGQEQKPGGPYRTWINCESTSAWNDYDPVINATIHYTLSKWKVKLSTLKAYLIKAIQTESWQSPYYTSHYLSLYLIIRSFTVSDYPEIKKNITEIFNSEPPQTQIDLACATIIASRLKLPLPLGFEKKFFALKNDNFAIESCIREQGSDESGCESLTAALWILATTEIVKNFVHPNLTKPKPAQINSENIHDAAISLVAQKLNNLNQSLFESSLPKLCQLIQTPLAKEITLFSHDLGSALTTDLTEELYIKLGAANLFGWLAWQWYDQCYDQKIISSGLPLANICLREATNTYLEAAQILAIDPEIIKETFDNTDKNHATELDNNLELQTNLKAGKKLTYLPTLIPTERSFGHCLGPNLIAKSLDLPDSQSQQLRRLFTHYLNTRQLCDDLHDWPEDFEAKRLTPVTRYLFMTTHLFPRAPVNQTNKIFWRDGLNQALANARHELQQANKALHSIDWPIHKPVQLVETLDRLNSAISQASSERRTSQALLTHYESVSEPI